MTVITQYWKKVDDSSDEGVYQIVGLASWDLEGRLFYVVKNVSGEYMEVFQHSEIGPYWRRATKEEIGELTVG